MNTNLMYDCMNPVWYYTLTTWCLWYSYTLAWSENGFDKKVNLYNEIKGLSSGHPFEYQILKIPRQQTRPGSTINLCNFQ